MQRRDGRRRYGIVAIGAALWACAPVKIVGDDPAAFQAHCDRPLSPGASPAMQEIQAGTCYEIGRALLEGAGIERDPVRGVAYLRQACVLQGLGARQSCAALGRILTDGTDGVPPDAVAAAQSYERACTLGLDTGCLNAGLMLDGNGGLKPDPARAVAMYEVGCDRGSGAACAFAAAALSTGAGVPVSAGRALERAARGCSLEHGPSCWLASELSTVAADVARFQAEACRLGEACVGGKAQ